MKLGNRGRMLVGALSGAVISAAITFNVLMLMLCYGYRLPLDDRTIRLWKDEISYLLIDPAFVLLITAGTLSRRRNDSRILCSDRWGPAFPRNVASFVGHT